LKHEIYGTFIYKFSLHLTEGTLFGTKIIKLMLFGRGVHRVLVGKPEGKRPLGRPRRRWVDNIKMDLQEVGGRGLWGLDGVGSGWGEVAGTCEYGNELWASIKCLEFLD
jgi:hypothetical protein